MRERRQEKIGWVGGWLGAFGWIAPLAVILLARGATLPAIAGLVILAVGCAALVLLAPWRHPRTKYWQLLAPLYMLFFCAVGWAIWSFGGARQIGINGWLSVLLVLPLMMPLWLGGRRRWQDGDAEPVPPAGGTSTRR